MCKAGGGRLFDRVARLEVAVGSPLLAAGERLQRGSLPLPPAYAPIAGLSSNSRMFKARELPNSAAAAAAYSIARTPSKAQNSYSAARRATSDAVTATARDSFGLDEQARAARPPACPAKAALWNMSCGWTPASSLQASLRVGVHAPPLK
jgi:hypothetical protein